MTGPSGPILREVQRVLHGAGALEAGPAAPPPADSPWLVDGRRSIEYWGSWDPKETARGRATSPERASALEAAAIARDLRELRDAGAPLDRAALVLRTAGRRAVYEDALRSAGLTFSIGVRAGAEAALRLLDFDEAARTIHEQVYLADLHEPFEPGDEAASDRELPRLAAAMGSARVRLVLAGCWPFGPMSKVTASRSPMHVLVRRAVGLPDLTSVPAIAPDRDLVIETRDGVRWVIPRLENR